MARWVRAEIAPRETIAATDGGAIRYFGEYQVLDLIGLNNRRLLHGERSGPAALAAVDPVVSFPALFSKLGRSDTWWPVPRTATAHLTIWDCPQSELVAFHRVP